MVRSDFGLIGSCRKFEEDVVEKWMTMETKWFLSPVVQELISTYGFEKNCTQSDPKHIPDRMRWEVGKHGSKFGKPGNLIYIMVLGIAYITNIRSGRDDGFPKLPKETYNLYGVFSPNRLERLV